MGVKHLKNNVVRLPGIANYFKLKGYMSCSYANNQLEALPENFAQDNSIYRKFKTDKEILLCALRWFA